MDKRAMAPAVVPLLTPVGIVSVPEWWAVENNAHRVRCVVDPVRASQARIVASAVSDCSQFLKPFVRA